MQFSVLGVAVAIALLVMVTGLGIGLATETTVYDDDIDYWIVPAGEGDRSPLVATGSPQFGDVHERNADIAALEGVDSTTPILTEVAQVEHGSHSEFILVIGVIGSPGVDSVAGVDSQPLTADDPYHHGDGWTGEIVLSGGAGSLLEASSGDSVTVSGNESFVVTAVDDGEASMGEVPTALVQLSELQTLTGADGSDQADQFVVGTNDPAVADELETVYEESSVLSRGELTASQTLDSDLPLALALTAFIISLVIGTLFVVTTSGLEIVADRTQLATMSAIGLSTRSQVTLTIVQTLSTTVLGGIVGSLLGLAGILAINEGIGRVLTVDSVALFHPLLGVYGVAVALIIGLLSLPYLFVMTRRISGGVP